MATAARAKPANDDPFANAIGAPEPPVAPLVPVTLHDFLAMRFPPRELLLAPWLPTKGLAMIYAARGVGKTHVALAVAYAVATGGTALG